MDANDRFPVFPTRMVHQLMKERVKTAEMGHNILTKKSEVLERKFRGLMKEIIDIKKFLGDIMMRTAYLLAEIKHITGPISNDILNRIGKAQRKVRSKTENIAGVQLQIYECYEDGEDQYYLTCLSKGGDMLKKLKEYYADAVDLLVHLATMQASFVTLHEVIRSTNRRVNALEHRYIPKLKNTVKYIENELDERERQDFYRLKMVKKKKKREKKDKVDSGMDLA